MKMKHWYKYTFINKRGLIDHCYNLDHWTDDAAINQKEVFLQNEPGKYLAINIERHHDIFNNVLKKIN